MDSSIEKIFAREILDSRGTPTIEVDVLTKSGHKGRAAVPSGASTGKYEAIELRDNNEKRFFGHGVKTAINNINLKISNCLKGHDVTNQSELDSLMIDLDGTENKSGLGANAILGVSMAIAYAGAKVKNQPLYQYIRTDAPYLMPLPMMNIINGGSHADNSVDIQEFMILPAGANNFSDTLQMGGEVFSNLKTVLQRKGLVTSVGDEGGFAPNLNSNDEAIEMILESIIKSGFKPGVDIFIALDVAASELYNDNHYILSSENKKLSSEEMIAYLIDLSRQYPIISIEDGLDENDWSGWKILTASLGKKVQIVGDDLTVTNFKRLSKAIKQNSMNAILIKPNQIGTITETITAIDLARDNSFGVIISHRSGETEDTTIADLAVSMGMGQIKTGSMCRTDRVCKYNQLLRIEEELGSNAKLAKQNVLGHLY